MPSQLPESIRRVLVTGGAVVRRLLRESQMQVFNLDKLGYASDRTGIDAELKALGAAAAERHQWLRVDLADQQSTQAAVQQADPDLVLHLAAASVIC